MVAWTLSFTLLYLFKLQFLLHILVTIFFINQCSSFQRLIFPKEVQLIVIGLANIYMYRTFCCTNWQKCSAPFRPRFVFCGESIVIFVFMVGTSFLWWTKILPSEYDWWSRTGVFLHVKVTSITINVFVKLGNLSVLSEGETKDHYAILGNCPPTPPLSQH